MFGITFDELNAGDSVGFDIIAGSRGLSPIKIERNGRPHDEEIIETADSSPTIIMRIAVQTFTAGLAEAIARDQHVLEQLEWRDLERLIAEVFAGLGFDVELTPASKDGGKDVIVSYCSYNGETKSYFVEIKHWRSGKKVLNHTVIEFLRVIATERKTGGILLATHGFAGNVIDVITKIHRTKLALGTNVKVVSLCRNYVKSSKGLWYPPEELENVIFEDTS